MYIPKQPRGKGICWFPSAIYLIHDIGLNDVENIEQQQLLNSLNVLCDSRFLKKIDFRKKHKFNYPSNNIQHQLVVVNALKNQDWKITDLYRKSMTTETSLLYVLKALNVACSRICWYEDKTCCKHFSKNANFCIVSHYFNHLDDIPYKILLPTTFELTIYTDELHSVILSKKNNIWFLLDCNYGKGIEVKDLNASDFSLSLCNLLQVEYNCFGKISIYDHCKIRGYCFICTQINNFNTI
tara:strand:- start:6566 stop:7285 length:720 start_codon:yes stop_codon:yes gene_type:complete